MPDLAQRLIDKLRAEGWTVEVAGGLLTAKKTTINSTWLFGSRRVAHRVCVRIDAQSHAVRVQELAKETVVGIPPPSFSVTRSTQTGLVFSEARRERGFGGGGDANYGELHAWLTEECTRIGWVCETTMGQP
ncbi:hypothetical protein [Zoogloea sp.]|uniref:hypothetical protein n=1 Tax=Zoogloea sp. TaxID=49181 RepID=UPI0026195DDB|nr:hypothetical protein [Zoogloea sp.]MDD3353077.1 hypothetical protein [Zoogloea sp.]